MDEIKDKIRDYLSRSLMNPEFGDDDDIFELGLVHSLFAIQLIVFIEKHFNLELEDADLDLQKFRTVSQIAELVQKKELI